MLSNFIKRILFIFFLISFISEINAQCPGNMSIDFQGARCAGSEITFINNSSGNVFDYSWTFEGGIIPDESTGSSASNVKHTFNNPGNFNVKLVRRCGLNSETRTINLQIVNAPQKPVITSSGNGECGGDKEISYGIQNQNGGNQYEWNFGDPSSGNKNTEKGTNVKHSFSATGNSANFQVRVAAVSQEGCRTDSDIRTEAIKSTPKVDVVDGDPDFNTGGNFTRCLIDGNSVDSVYVFTFDNQSSSDDPNTTYTFNWGDGTANQVVPKGTQVTHKYESFGVSKLNITAVNTISGCTVKKEIEIVNEKFPSASLSIPPAQVNICDSTVVTINNNSQNATNFIWYWGDSDTTTSDVLAPITHLFKLQPSASCAVTSALGFQMNVKLEAQNSCFSHENSSPINIRPLPIANFTSNKGMFLCFQAGLPTYDVAFTLTSCPTRTIAGFATTYKFEIKDPNNPKSLTILPNQSNIVNHTFTAAGVYPLKMTATNSCGSNVFLDTLYISEPAIAKFGNTENASVSSSCTEINLPDMSPSSSCGPFNLELKNLSKNLLESDNVQWSVTPAGANFGSSNGASSTSYDDNVAFDIGKTYTLTLAVSNECNAASPSKACAIVKVKDIPKLNKTLLAGFEDDGFELTKGDRNTAAATGDTLEYSKCDQSALNNLHIEGLDDSTKTYKWNVQTLSGSTTGYATPNDSLPGKITFNPGQYVLNVTLGNECGDTITPPVKINILEPEPADAGGTVPAVTACKDTSYNGKAGVMKELVQCSGETFNLGKNTAKAGITYEWTTDGAFTVDSAKVPNTTVTLLNNDTTGTNTCQIVYVEVDNGVCAKMDSVLLVVRPAPAINIGALDSTICKNTPEFTLNFTPAGGGWSADSNNVVTALGKITPSQVPVGTYKLSYQFTDPSPQGCSLTLNKNLTFADSTPVKILLDSSVCESDIAFQANANPMGGLWSASVISAITNDGMLTSSEIGQGNTSDIFYFFEDANGCISKDTATIAVDVPVIPKTGFTDSICFNETNIQLKAITPNGIWIDTTGTMSLTSAGVFSPNGLASALYQVYYEINTGTPCVRRSLKDVFIKPLTSITITEPIGPFCAQDAAQAIHANPSGGTWTAPNSSVSIVGADTLFSPQKAGENLAGHQLTYSFTNNFKCTSTKNTSVIILPLPIVEAGPNIVICQNTEAFQITGFSPSTGGINEWTIKNVSFNTVDDNALYQPDSIASDTLYFKYSLASGCNSTDSVVINVIAPVDADAGFLDSVCVGANTYALLPGASTPFNAAFGSLWQGTGVIAGSQTIDLTSLQSTDLNKELEYIYRYGTGNCETFDTTKIVVFAMPEITPPLVPKNSLCQDASIEKIDGYEAFTLGVTSFDSAYGAWSGPGISQVGNTYFFDPETAGASSVPLAILYTYTDSSTSNCVSTYEHFISVEALPVPSFDMPDLYCVGKEMDILNTSTIAFGSLDSSFWNFTPIDSLAEKFSNQTKFTYPLSGEYTVSYRVVSVKGCDSTITHQIKIIDPPKASFTLSTAPLTNCGPVTALIVDNSSGFDSTYFWNFGLDLDTISSYLENDTSLVYNQGFLTDTSYFVTLIVENQCARDTMVDTVKVLPLPIASFGTDKSVGCSPALFNFNNNSVGVIDGVPTFYNFSFSDGSAAEGPITHKVLGGKRIELGPKPRSFVYNGFNDTTYTITMIATNTCGADTAFHSIKVLPNDVIAFFNQNVNEGCSPLVVNYSDFSTNSTFVSYDFGDNTSIVARNTSHTFVNNTNAIKVFDVAQRVNNACSYDTIVQSVRVFPIPKANFVINANATCERDSIHFVNKSTGHNNSQWIFVNELDTIKNINSDVFYQFNLPGSQEIKLVVSESLHQCTDTVSKNIQISVVPKTSFSSDSISACEPFEYNETMVFQDAGDLFTWIDYLGDTVSLFNTIKYDYAQDGDYIMHLVTTSANGCTDIDSIFFDILPSPKASFKVVEPVDKCVFPKQYGYVSTSTVDAQNFEWYFDGVLNSTLNQTSFVYNAPDTMSVRLKATNNFNCSDEISKPILIQPMPIADFIAVETEGCEPFLTQFQNQSLNASDFVWNFGDFTASERSTNVNHLYTDGEYDVQLIASSVEGCKDTLLLKDYIYVLNKPEADFVYKADEDPKLYGTIHFKSTSLFSTFYTWDFGTDKESLDADSITYRFDFYGDRKVTLITANENNCKDTVTKVIHVPFFGGLYVPNAFVPSSGNTQICRFKPVGLGLSVYRCQIFDTWGNLIWETTAIDADGAPAEGWDGTFKGNPLPENSYVWKIEATFVDGYVWEGMKYEGDARKRKVGSVTLVR